MDQSLKTSAIEDLNLASKLLSETVPMTTNDRIVLALVEHALVKLESAEVFTPTTTSIFSSEWGSDISRFIKDLDYKIKIGIEYTTEFVGVRGDFEVYKVSQVDGEHPEGYCLYSLKHKEYSENIYATDFGCLEDVERYFAFLPVKKLKPDTGLKETSLPPHKKLVKPWPVDVRGPMVRVPNLIEELKSGTKYCGVVHLTVGQMHIFRVTNVENRLEPAKYVLYSIEHDVCSDWLHVSPEAALADMDYFLRVVVSKVKEPSKEKGDDRGSLGNFDQNKVVAETKTFVNLESHLERNKGLYVKDHVETETFNGETGSIFSVKAKNSDEVWFALERSNGAGKVSLCNVMYRTVPAALDAFYAQAKNNIVQQ